jgi:CDP-paratose 2-epimerase
VKILITGSAGLVGSEAAMHYAQSGCHVCGIDNNMRKAFFGEGGDTTWNLLRLRESLKNAYEHFEVDIRDAEAVEGIFRGRRFDGIIHCAAQPSHDKAAEIPYVDFGVNATGTLNVLEATRRHCPDAVFIHMSTNKVYGDAPNQRRLRELDTRWEYADPSDHNGIDESCSIDQCLHSLFGASKVAGDVLAQEYGRYFGMKVGVFRGGCLTGPQHSGVELHGFLSYLVKAAVNGIPYRVYGYKGKQVRDNIHSKDVITAFDGFIREPRCGEVYNIGGGRENSVSILEAIARIEDIGGYRVAWRHVDQARRGDHICYITDLSKLKSHNPSWSVTIGIDEMLTEMIRLEESKGRGSARC